MTGERPAVVFVVANLVLLAIRAGADAAVCPDLARLFVHIVNVRLPFCDDIVDVLGSSVARCACFPIVGKERVLLPLVRHGLALDFAAPVKGART